jgi:hypothetical protein
MLSPEADDEYFDYTITVSKTKDRWVRISLKVFTDKFGKKSIYVLQKVFKMDKESKEWLRFNWSSLNTNEFEQYSGRMKTLTDKIQELYDNELPSSVPNTPIPNEQRRGGEQASNLVYYNLD